MAFVPIRDTKLIGGRLCLDFTNTTSGRSGASILGEKLESLDDLLLWSHRAGISKEKSPSKSSGSLKKAIEFREALYRIFLSAMNHRPPKQRDLQLLNQQLHHAADHESVAWTKDGFRKQSQSQAQNLDSILWAVANSAADLLTKDDLNRLRQCDGENCGWLFYDESKNNRREWCDMSDCGNRAKVRRFRSHKRK
jgi:predicted RNA-binding Zn ribbon-like protein